MWAYRPGEGETRMVADEVRQCHRIGRLRAEPFETGVDLDEGLDRSRGAAP